MQGQDTFSMKLNSGGPLVTVSKQQKYYENGVLHVVRCTTYSEGTRFLSLNITTMEKADRVNTVCIRLAEKSGKGSFANLNLQFIRNERYGILCGMQSELSGPYKLVKKNYCVPPLPDAELVSYHHLETGDESGFTIEKKKGRSDEIAVESVTATHSFMVGEKTLCVKVKITNDTRDGTFDVEVEGPALATTDDRALKIENKMERKMVNNMRSIFGIGNGRPLRQ